MKAQKWMIHCGAMLAILVLGLMAFTADVSFSYERSNLPQDANTVDALISEEEPILLQDPETLVDPVITGYDAILHAQSTTGRFHDLIGTYDGWDTYAVYIAGYNDLNTVSRYTRRVIFGGQSIETMTVDLMTGRVGIGTTSPTEALEVVGNIKISGTGNGIIFPNGSKQTTAGGGGADNDWDGAGTGKMYTHFLTDRIGIGTTNPSEKLHVVGSLRLDKAGTALGRLILNTGTRNDPGRYGIVFTNNSLAPFLGDDTQEQIYSFLTGWSPNRVYSARLRVHGRASGSWGNYLEMTHDGNNGIIDTDVGHIIINPAKNVGIGTTSPGSYKLAVNGTAAKPGGGFWSTFSDVRLKEIHSSYERGLSEVTRLNPINYSYRQDNDLKLPAGKQFVGLVAQEVQKVVPEAVEENSDGYLMINSDPIIWAMLNSIKELKAENDQIKTENDQLKQRLDALEQKVNKQSLPIQDVLR